MGRQQLFEMCWEGNIAQENIVIEIIKDSLKRTEDSEKWIENKWQEKVLAGLKVRPDDTKPTRFRFCGFREKDEKLIVLLDPCVSYRDALGSRSYEFVKRFGSVANPNPFSATVIIVTPDFNNGGILIAVRSKDVDHKPSGFQVSLGGIMDLDDENPTTTIYREIKEECGLEEHEIQNLRCNGIVHSPWHANTDIIFSASTNVTLRNIRKRKKDKENEAFFVIPAERRSIEALITKVSHATLSSSLASMFYMGKHLSVGLYANESAQIWHNKILAALMKESKNYMLPKARARLEARDIVRFQKFIKS